MKKVKNPKSLCLHCFGELDFRKTCKDCGKMDEKTFSPPHQLPSRCVLNKKYVIVRTLGEGGFGITYLAYDLMFNRTVAIKEYYPNGYVSRNPHSHGVIINLKDYSVQFNRGLKRFIEEARNLSAIKNLNGIVRVLDFFTANDTAYIAMEYLDGISLKKYVQKKGKLSASTTLTILHPVISSLAEVHNAGMIHRDISPDNILITRKSEVKLIDFGAAKSNDEGNSHSIVLKQGFAPEEQYRSHGIQGPWSDIYALGVTIYYCITGQLPPESIQRLYDDNISLPSTLGADITTPQEKSLMRAMAVLAKDRYVKIEDFEHDIYNDSYTPPVAEETKPEIQPKTVEPQKEEKIEPEFKVRSIGKKPITPLKRLERPLEQKREDKPAVSKHTPTLAPLVKSNSPRVGMRVIEHDIKNKRKPDKK